MENINKVKDMLPDHLKEFVVEQDTTDYQPVDHAVWRYCLRQLKNFLSTNAHDCYLDGLQKTGITVEEIPSIDSVCKKLNEFGWSAIPVSGFIPPAAFMEMQSLGILPIASGMRTLDHILYTPAPDIVHEAAGHAPILINPDFARYLKQYAAVAKNAIVSSEDLALYEAIRDLSDIKEHPDSTEEDIAKAEKKLNDISNSMTVVSEATLLGRMNWWTAEYGLIGDMRDPKIYGAGLLSSYGEAKECLSDKVKKIPLSVDCTQYSYDITEPQPQLFVAESFKHLTDVLHALSLQLAYKKGGLFGIEKAIEAKTVNSIQLNSGLQISGRVVETLKDEEQCLYFKCEGPTQLCVGNQELEGHGKDYHNHGFSSPIGFVEGFDDCLSWASDEDLKAAGIIENQSVTLQFESGIVVKGKLIGKTRTRRNELCILSFTDCHVTYKSKKLFEPEWGTFDMAVGSKIESVFSGPADRKKYGLIDNFASKRVPKKQQGTESRVLNNIYAEIRQLRNSQNFDLSTLEHIFSTLQANFKTEWLPRIELIELTYETNSSDALRERLIASLEKIMTEQLDKQSVIRDGLTIASQKL